jgi:hypothetical protein
LSGGGGPGGRQGVGFLLTDRGLPGRANERNADMARKTSQEIAQENLEIAERVLVKKRERAEKTKADAEKAQADLRLAERKVKAARMIALDEETEIDSYVEPAAAPAGDDVL